MARIGIDADAGSFDIQSPKATFEFETELPKVEIRSFQGQLRIDQSKAWDGLGLGGTVETLNRIYSNTKQIFLQGIARRVEQGDHLAAIHLNTNAIADNAEQITTERPEFNTVGEAAYDNVDVSYTQRKPEITAVEGKVHANIVANSPKMQYIRGKLDIYMLQYPKVEITPPQIDLRH